MKRATQMPSGIEHPFAPYIRILGKGKTGTRSLDIDEARQAFGMILRGEAESVQLGAFLMLLRVKEESAEELAGFVQACREEMIATPDDLVGDIDWSCYAGKKHQHPWFILSMLLLAEAGHRIFVHGSTAHTAGRLYTEDAMRQLRLPVASNWNEVREQLNGSHLSYLPLTQFCPNLDALMQLRSLLGLRSPVNTLSRLLNPLRAAASIQSVFHPPYARLHQLADQLLQQPRAIVFKGESGEAEIKPQANSTIYLLEQGRSQELLIPRSISKRAQTVEFPSVDPLRGLWRGTAMDDYGLAATLATTTAGLLAVSPGLNLESAQNEALLLWQNRNRSRLH